MSFLVEKKYYTFYNVFNYQIFDAHCRKAADSEGKLGHRIVHALIAILEFFPVIGQIVAQIELGIYGYNKAIELKRQYATFKKIKIFSMKLKEQLKLPVALFMAAYSINTAVTYAVMSMEIPVCVTI